MAAEQKVKRKLSAILSADVKGYSRLMSDDESHTIVTLKAHRSIMTKIIQQHSGRVVDAPGDNLLAEFSSIVNAVQSAVEIQKTLEQENANVPRDKRLEFRIGVNIGDVVQDGEALFGEGVNIAARIEGLADPGGICISRGAYDHIRNKLKLGYEYLGEHRVKNIKNPVRVYKLLMALEDRGKLVGTKPKRPMKRWVLPVSIVTAIVMILTGYKLTQRLTAPGFEPVSLDRMVFPLPDKPSIAVLPFDNMGGNPDQDFFSDGLTEEIITALSRTPKLFVIARHSTFTYKGLFVKVQEIAEDLGVRYILEGSVKRSGDRIRINARLIDALSGHHLWTEQYDRNFSDVFAVQDDITKEILLALQINLTHGEQARIYAKGTDNLSAYLKAIQAQWYAYQGTKEGNSKARKLIHRAIELDSDYAYAYRILGVTHVVEVFLKTSESPKRSIQQAIHYCKKAIALDESFAAAYASLGYIMAMVRKYDEGVRLGKKAFELEPDSADVLHIYAAILTYAGMEDEAIPLFRRALRLNPKPPNAYYRHFGHALRASGQFEEAMALQKKAIRLEPDDILAYVILASSAGLAGHDEDARSAVKEILRIDPEYSCARLIAPFKDKNQIDRVAKVLGKAGLPDKPALQLPDKPFIAILPFVNMSDDPEQEFFSDGLTKEIITALSKTPKLFVISGNSTFAYKDKPVEIQRAAQELGVRYVLEGSVRKYKERVRITAQLIDAKTGHHLWAERYDRNLIDIFAVQDEITMEILGALEIKLTEGEQSLFWKKGTKNLDVYLKFLKGLQYGRNVNPENNVRARKIFEDIVSQEPEYAHAYRIIGWTYWSEVWLGTATSPKESLKKAVAYAKKALSIDPFQGGAYVLLGHIGIIKKDWEIGISLLRKGIEIEPSGADYHMYLGMGLCFSGRPEQAIPVLEKAMKLNPFAQPNYYQSMGIAYRMLGQYDKAVEYLEKGALGYPDHFFCRLNLTACYILAGRKQDAYAEAKEVIRLNPRFSLNQFERTLPFKNQKEKDKLIGALRAAGLK